MPKIVNRNKSQKQIELNYLNHSETKLEDCYAKPSVAKKTAFMRCRWMHKELDCGVYWMYKYRILSYNTFSFTYGGYYEKVNEETGEVETWFYYATSKKEETWKVC